MHKLNCELKRDDEGILLVDSECLRCGTSKVVSMRDGSLQEWESHHVCGNLRVIHPTTF